MTAPRTATPPRRLSAQQISAIRQVMHLFLADDLARGISTTVEHFCHGCGSDRPLPGFIRYETYQLCNPCATRFELAHAQAEVRSIQQFVRRRPGAGERMLALGGHR